MPTQPKNDLMSHKPLASFAIAAVLLGPASLMAQPNLEISITMRKEVQLSTNTPLYRIRFNLDGAPLKKARAVTIGIPSGKKMQIQNPLRLNIINLEVAESDYPYLIKTFPEGDYKLKISPKPKGDKGARSAFLSHDFPAALALITPSPNQTALPLNFTAQWFPIANAVNNIFVEITGPEVSFSATLPPSATSFTVPDGLLAPSQTYRMGLGVRVEGDATGNHETVQVVDFTTAP